MSITASSCEAQAVKIHDDIHVFSPGALELFLDQ